MTYLSVTDRQYADRALEAVESRPGSVTVATVARSAGLDGRTARRLLDHLVTEGRLLASGTGRTRRYWSAR